jgi:hypothetical protein
MALVSLGGYGMKLPRRRFFHLAAGAVALPAVSCAVRAELTKQGASGFYDGLADAPAGTPQYPNLFTDPAGGPPTSVGPFPGAQQTRAPYTHAPSWHVAGVHYRVGIPSNITLIQPTQVLGQGSPAGNTLTNNGATTSGNVLHFASTTGVMVGMTVAGTNIPGGAKVTSKSTNSITLSASVTGAGVASGTTITFSGISVDAGNLDLTAQISNLVFDGIDLSGGTGWQISNKWLNGVYDTTIQNCRAQPTAPSGVTGKTPIAFVGLSNGFTGAGLTVRYCEIDARCCNECLSANGDHGAHPCIVEYCWLKNAQANTISGLPEVMRFNIIENSGTAVNAAVHCEYIQTYPSSTFTARFNGTATIGFDSRTPVDHGDRIENVFKVGDTTIFYSGVPPQLIDRHFPYFVVAVDPVDQTFQVSATSGGTPIMCSAGSCIATYPETVYNTISQYNTIIMNNNFRDNAWGTLGFCMNGNGHYCDGDTLGSWAIYGNCDIGYNTIICVANPDATTAGGGVTYIYGVDLALTKGPFTVHDNFCDLSAVKYHVLVNYFTGRPQGPGTNARYNGPINVVNNKSLITGATVV